MRREKGRGREAEKTGNEERSWPKKSRSEKVDEKEILRKMFNFGSAK